MFQAVRNNGDFRICCQANGSADRGILRHADGSVANAASDDPVAARNLPLMRDARQKMLKGEWPQSCVRCTKEEAAGLRSRRTYEIQFWGKTVNAETVSALTQPDGWLNTDAVPLRSMDIRFGNKCNLKCRMCGATDSDLWYADHAALFGPSFEDTHGQVKLEQDKTGRWRASSAGYEWYETADRFWRQLDASLPSLEHIHIVGGEPLLLQRHYELIEKIVRAGESKHIILEYNTNLTILPQKVLDLWSDFKAVRVGVSLDGYGALNDYIRSPSKWSLLEKNLHRLDQAAGPIDCWISATMQIYNIFYLPELITWRLAAGFKRFNKSALTPLVTSHPVHSPKHLNIRALPAHAKLAVQQKFAAYEAQFTATQAHSELQKRRLNEVLAGYIKFMYAEDLSRHFPEFVKYTQSLDAIRGQSFYKVAPEWSGILHGKFEQHEATV